MRRFVSFFTLFMIFALTTAAPGRSGTAHTRHETLPPYLHDRGSGVSSSLFGTYIEPGQLLIFPFFAYSRDRNREYQPAQLGFGLNEDFRGRYRDASEQIFIAFGVSD